MFHTTLNSRLGKKHGNYRNFCAYKFLTEKANYQKYDAR